MPTIEHKNLTGTDLHEPKGIAAASEFDVYQADGSSGGSWVSIDELIERAYIYIAVDSGSQTFVFGAGDLDAEIPFSLSYETIGSTTNMTFENTGNTITYSGDQSINAHVIIQMSHALTAGANTTLKVRLQKSTDSGSNWVTQDASLSARKFASSDVGNLSLNSIITLAPDDEIRFTRECDVASTFTATNINISVRGAA